MTDRITVSSETVENQDGEEVERAEWLEINARLASSVQTHAMENNQRFGDALVSYLSEEVGSGDSDE